MPYITNPTEIASQPDFLNAVRSLLSNYCTEKVLQQPRWTTGGGGDTPWQKRLAFAQAWINGSISQTAAVRLTAQLIAELDGTLTQQINTNLFRYLWQENTTSSNFMECRTGLSVGLQAMGAQSGVSVYDALCGITLQDMQ